MHHTFQYKVGTLININYQNEACFFLFDASKLPDDMLTERARVYLHPNELLIYDKRKKTMAKKEFLVSRYIIKSVIAQWHNVGFHDIDIFFNVDSSELKARIHNQQLPYNLSLAHSKGLVFVVICNDNLDIGVDVEFIDSTRDINKLAENFYYEDEAQAVVDEGKSTFFRLWTLKEAWAKVQRKPIVAILGQCFLTLPDNYHYFCDEYMGFSLAAISCHPINNNVIYLCKLPQLTGST